jgi:import receptor subunit TOM20
MDMKTTTIVAASVGTAVTFLAGRWLVLCRSLLTSSAYALYFDHRRRTDPEFRKALKKEGKRQARLAKEEAEAQSAQQRAAIKAAYKAAQEEGFPTSVEDREQVFLQEVSQGEAYANDGTSIQLLETC